MYTLLVRILTAIPLGTLVVAAKTYHIQDWYQGQSFVGNWSFFEGPDPTQGNVNYLDKDSAVNQGIAFVNNTDGTFTMGVDSQSDVDPGGMRNSVRINSPNTYNGGLFVLDAAQMPVGCGTWPAFWLISANVDWPVGGEIDVVEGINDQSHNQMTLHTGTDKHCALDPKGKGKYYTGQHLHVDCYSTEDSNSGCSMLDSNKNSFGYGFNAGGGGVFVLLWDNHGMSMWSFPRHGVPADLTKRNPTPAKWPMPAGFWGASTCDFKNNFYDQVMILDTTICGYWASSTYGHSGCPGVTCSDIVANKSNFVDAKWKINYIAVYQ